MNQIIVKFITVAFVLCSIELVEAHHMKYHHCCNVPEFDKNSIVDKCKVEDNDEEQTKKFNPKKFHNTVCQVECMANELSFLENNELNINSINKAIAKVGGSDADGIKFLNEKAALCLEEAKKPHPGSDKHKHQIEEGDDGKKCSFETFKFMMCLGKETTLNCPTDKKVESPECEHQSKMFEKMSKM